MIRRVTSGFGREPPGGWCEPVVRSNRVKWIGLAVAVTTAAVLGWRWYTAVPALPPLEGDWPAVVFTIAGTDDTSRFSDPFGVGVMPDGTVVVADGGESPRILRVAGHGAVSTLAGGVRGFADGTGPAAKFDTPSGLAIDDGGNVYVADTGNHAIRRISPDGRVITLAGDGIAGDTDGPRTHARFNGPVGVAVDRQGRVIVADTYNDRIRAIAADGSVTTIAGARSAGADDGPVSSARFDTPCALTIDASGQIYVADTGNGVVRRVLPSGFVTTIGQALTLRPMGIAVDRHGTVFVADERGRIVELKNDFQRTVAGSTWGFADGGGGDAKFRRLAGLALADDGHLVVADAGNAVVRTVVALGRAPRLVPSSPIFSPGFDHEAFARAPLLWPIDPMEGPHEVAGTMGEARGTEGSERFHAGIDVRIDDGTMVRAIRDGVVTTPISTGDFNSLNEWIRVGAVGYVHVRAGRTRGGDLIAHEGFVPGFGEDGKLTRLRVRRGARFSTGDPIATVNRFNHVHLNVGWPGEEINPLDLRIPFFEDSIPPTIATGGIHLYDEAWQPIVRPRRGPPVASGRVRIVVDGWDQADGNRPNRRLGLYALGYEVLKPDGTPAAGFERPRETIAFNRLAVQPDAATLVYAPGSGIPFYRGRRTRFLYIATNTFKDGEATEGFWDTTGLPPGPYILRIHARDVRGNAAVANRDLRVVVQ